VRARGDKAILVAAVTPPGNRRLPTLPTA
jgi:hypothetical protein